MKFAYVLFEISQRIITGIRTPLFLIILTGLFYSACVEEVDWKLKSQDNGRLVVEAILTNQTKIQQVRLSLSFDELSQEAINVDDADVKVTAGGEVYSFRRSLLDPGLYLSREPFSARKDQIYTLSIYWNNEIYEASEELSFVAPLGRITFLPVSGGDSLKINQVAPVYHPLEQSMYEIFVDWQPINPMIPRGARLFYYTFSTIDGNEIFRPAMDELIFPRGSRVIVHKYGLDAGFAEYLRTLVMETQWQGGVFDEASSSLESNISIGALGYFSVCAVLSDTLLAR